MIRIFAIILVVVLVGVSACCNCSLGISTDSGSIISINQGVKGSGVITSIRKDFSDFDSLRISHAFHASVKQGDAHGVQVRVDDNLQDMLDIRKEGRTLCIGLKPGTSVSNGTFEADITLPALRALDLSGASAVKVGGFSSGDPLNLELSGASQLRGDLATGDLQLHASGASDVDLTGSCRDLELHLSGASNADLSRLVAQDVHVMLSGASHGTVKSDGILEGEASGASQLTYFGKPRVGNLRSSGASEFTPGSQ